MRTIIAVALVLAAGGANAAPIYLSCSGDWRQGSIGLFQTETILISLDTDKGTVMYEETTLKIYRNTDVEIWAADRGYGLDMRLNRLTGRILISTAILGEAVKIPGWSTFEGICKPALAGGRMIRGLIFVLALAGPAMAEQPTHELGVQCGKEASVAVHQELEPLPYDIRKPETMKAYKEGSDHAFSETYLKTFEWCMLQNGFKFRSDVHYCADNVNPPHKPNEPLGLTSLLENVCYERIR